MLNLKLTLPQRTRYLGAPMAFIAPAVAGAAISAAGSLLSGIFGNSSTSSANKRNVALAREQMDFNAKQARAQRDWQEKMYDTRQSLAAQYAQMRSSGVNQYLANASNGSVGQGSSATSGELPFQQPENSFANSIGQAANNAVQVDMQERALRSQVSVNDTIESLNESQKALSDATAELKKAETDQTNANIEEIRQRVNNLSFVNEYLSRTMESRVRQQYMIESTQTWQQQDAKYSALRNAYQFFNVDPLKADEIQANINQMMAHSYQLYAQGKLSYTEIQYMPKKVAALTTMSYAALLNAKTAEKVGNEQARGMSIENDFKQRDWDFSQEDYGVTSFIRKNSNARFLYNLNLENAKYFNEKLKEEPNLIRSMIGVNNSEIELTPYKKWDYGTRSFKNVASGVGDIVRSVTPFSKVTRTESRGSWKDDDGSHEYRSYTDRRHF